MGLRKQYAGFDMQGNVISGLPDATAVGQPATYGQLQNALFGLDFKNSVRVASPAGTNITITAPGANIDSVAMVNGDRVLLKDQTTASENGLYVWNGASAAMTRATDGAQGNLSANATTYVEEGTVNADTQWVLSTNNPINVGTTSLTFVRTGATGVTYVQGEGITITGGNTINVDRTKVPEFYSTTFGDGSASTFTITHSLNNTRCAVQLILVSDGSTIDADVKRINANQVTVTTSGALIPANGGAIICLG